MSQAALRHWAAATTAPGLARPTTAAARLRVVPAAIERTGTGKFAAMCMALLTLGLLTLLMLNAQLAQGSFTLHDLQTTSGTLSDQEHELTRALDAERNPGALARRALGMGMVPATSMAFIRLDDGTILGVAEPAVAKTLNVVSIPKPPSTPSVAAPTPVVPSAPAATATPGPADAAAADPESPGAAPTTTPGG